MIIGKGIKTVRKKLNISQVTFAQKCRLSQAALSRIERGAKTPTIKAMKRICTTLQIPEAIIYIIGMQETDVPQNKIHTYRLVHPTIISLALQIADTENANALKTA